MLKTLQGCLCRAKGRPWRGRGRAEVPEADKGGESGLTPQGVQLAGRTQQDSGTQGSHIPRRSGFGWEQGHQQPEGRGRHDDPRRQARWEKPAGMRPTEGALVQAVCVCTYAEWSKSTAGLGDPQLGSGRAGAWQSGGGRKPGSPPAEPTYARRQGSGLGGSRAQGTLSLSKGQLWRVWGAKGGREVPLRPGSCSDSRRAAWEGSPGCPGRWHTAIFTYSN